MTKEELEDKHQRLDDAVTRLEKLRETDRSEDGKMKLKDLKKQKLLVKDKLNNIRE